MESRNPCDLIPALGRSYLFVMQAALKVVGERFAALDAEHGLTVREFWILLAASEQQLSQGLIAQCLGVNKNVMVKVIDGGVRKGLWKRVRNPKNRREFFIQVTARGSGVLKGAFAEQQGMLLKAFYPLSRREVDQMREWGLAILDHQDGWKQKSE